MFSKHCLPLFISSDVFAVGERHVEVMEYMDVDDQSLPIPPGSSYNNTDAKVVHIYRVIS